MELVAQVMYSSYYRYASLIPSLYSAYMAIVTNLKSTRIEW